MLHKIQPNIKGRLEEILDDGKARGFWKTKTEFTEVMGISPQVLSNVLSPTMDREVPKSLIMGLARVNYNITWLLYGTGPYRNNR